MGITPIALLRSRLCHTRSWCNRSDKTTVQSCLLTGGVHSTQHPPCHVVASVAQSSPRSPKSPLLHCRHCCTKLQMITPDRKVALSALSHHTTINMSPNRGGHSPQHHPRTDC